MANARKFNGERLRRARTYRGMTISELAERLSLNRQTITLYEDNRITTPDFNVISAISRTLEFPAEFFLEEDKVAVITGSTYFRALLTTNKMYRNEQIQKMEIIVRIFRFLKEYIEFPKLSLPESGDDTDPEKAAQILRKHWQLGDRPIDNIVYHAEQNGILMTSFVTPTNDVDAFSQMLSIDGNSEFLIAYSKNKTSAARIHFDVAHELGHILLHSWTEDVEALDKIEFREREQQAHSFASAFLLPREAFEQDLGAYATKIDYYMVLKRKWKVSISAMIRRAFNIGKIDTGTYQRLMRTMQKMGIKKVEPLDDVIVTAVPSLFGTAIRMLLDQNVFTPREFLDELSHFTGLSLYGKEIEFLLDLESGTLKDSETNNNIVKFESLALKKSLK